MQIDLDTLKRRILEATKKSAVADQIEEVDLEPDRDEEGTEFLRVIVQVKTVDSALDAAFEALLEKKSKEQSARLTNNTPVCGSQTRPDGLLRR